MLTAITRAVSPALNQCELSYLDRDPIDVGRAREQHARYQAILQTCGARLIQLPAEPGLPDSMFVEDPAIVVEEVAVITRMGVASRRDEADSLAVALEPFRPIIRMEPPATLEGGDVMRIGKTLYAGLSKRTDIAGIYQLAEALQPYGYKVHAVEMKDCLHLKSGASYLGNDTVLLNPDWIDSSLFAHLNIIPVQEKWAANVLSIGGRLIMPERFPKTRAALEHAGWRVETLDTTELAKAEAGVTCMSLIFEA